MRAALLAVVAAALWGAAGAQQDQQEEASSTNVTTTTQTTTSTTTYLRQSTSTKTTTAAPAPVTETETTTTSTTTVTTLDISGEQCDGTTTLSFYPGSVQAMSRRKIFFPRGCEVDRCCVGDVCNAWASPVVEDGQTVCHTPLVGNAEQTSVKLYTSDGTELRGAGPLLVTRAFEDLWSSSHVLYSYIYEQRRWARSSETGRWTSTSTGRYQMCQYSWGISGETCCHLVGLGMDFQVLPLPIKWCSEQRWGCSSVGDPWSDPQVQNALAGFQLRGLAVMCNATSLPQEEYFFPTPLLSRFNVDPLEYVQAWATRDARHAAVAGAIKQVATSFLCPAFTGLSPRPRQLWEAWSMDPAWVSAGAATCWRSWAAWWRGIDGAVRCCYDDAGAYIQEWPSRVTFTSGQMSQWSREDEDDVEKLTCAADLTGPACEVYKSRRPAIPPTNNLYAAGSGWEVPRPFGGGWGDPHCKSVDGLEFECNFRGEAVWAGCEEWRVHAIAEQLGNASATIITKVSIRYGAETLVAKLNASVSMEADDETGLAPTRYTLLLNGTEPVGADDGGASGNFMTATGFNNVLTVEDVAGNVVKASFLKSLVVLQVAPRDGCFNKTFGLSGNNNGDKSDDLTVKGTGEVLPTNASSSVIFDKFVKSFQVTAQADSIFPAADFVPVVESFTPAFVDELDLSQCPEACNGNGACCLDASLGGEELVEAFTAAAKDIEETNSEAVGFYDNMRPVFAEAPSLFVPIGSALRLKYVATDSDNVSALSCDICPDVNAAYADTHQVICELTGIGTNSTVMVIRAGSLDYGSFKCFCKDGLGANATSMTQVVAELKTTSVDVWAKEEAENIERIAVESGDVTVTLTSTSTATLDLLPNQGRVPSDSGGVRVAPASGVLLGGVLAIGLVALSGVAG